MQQEYFDIVDENNVPLGKTELRSIVHENGLWHRVVHIFLFRKLDGEIELLVHLRSKEKDSKPNMWAIGFGGHVQAGETVEKALEGEARDEIGLDMDPTKIVRGMEGKHNGKRNKEFSRSYYYPFNENLKNLQFNDGEVQAVKWMSVSKIEYAMNAEPENWTFGVDGLHMVISDMHERLKK